MAIAPSPPPAAAVMRGAEQQPVAAASSSDAAEAGPMDAPDEAMDVDDTEPVRSADAPVAAVAVSPIASGGPDAAGSPAAAADSPETVASALSRLRISSVISSDLSMIWRTINTFVKRRQQKTDECLDIVCRQMRTIKFDSHKEAPRREGQQNDEKNNWRFFSPSTDHQKADVWKLTGEISIGELILACEDMRGMVCSTLMPRPQRLQTVLANYLLHEGLEKVVATREDDKANLAKSAHALLRHILFLHNPNDRRKRCVYLSAMRRGKLDEQIKDESETSKIVACWNLVKSLLEDASATPQPEANKILALDIVTEIIQSDLEYWWKHSGAKVETEKPILYLILEQKESNVTEDHASVIVDGYMAATADAAKPYFRRLIAMLALLAGSLDASKDNRVLAARGTIKNKLALTVAKSMQRAKLSADRLRTELLLLRPPWLAALVAAEVVRAQTDQRIRQLQLKSVVPLLSRCRALCVDGGAGGVAAEPHEKRTAAAAAAEKMDVEGRRNNAGDDKPPPRPSPPSSSSSAANSPGKKKNELDAVTRNAHGETALHVACRLGDLGRLKDLLANAPSADVNAPDFNGWTPVHEAAAFNQVGCLRALFAHRTSGIHQFLAPAGDQMDKMVDLRAKGGPAGLTPFLDAVRLGHADAVQFMLNKSSELNKKFSGQFPSVSELVGEQTDAEGNTAGKLCAGGGGGGAASRKVRDVLAAALPADVATVFRRDSTDSAGGGDDLAAIPVHDAAVFAVAAARLVDGLLATTPSHVVARAAVFFARNTESGEKREFRTFKNMKELETDARETRSIRWDNQTATKFTEFKDDLVFFDEHAEPLLLSADTDGAAAAPQLRAMLLRH